MAKTEAEVAAKTARKEAKKKRKLSETANAEDDVEIPREQKKKEKKRKSSSGAEATAAIGVDEDGDVVIADAAPDTAVAKKEAGAVVEEAKVQVPLAALVPFANPLCDEKSQKKVLKSVKKAAKSKALKRGVKECLKAIRKSPLATPSTDPATSVPSGIVVLAADISPMDVISHIPVLCEDHGIPYVYVPSRAELGAAGATKRPTSIVMVSPRVGKGAKDKDADEKEWGEQFAELQKLAVKLGASVRV